MDILILIAIFLFGFICGVYFEGLLNKKQIIDGDPTEQPKTKIC